MRSSGPTLATLMTLLRCRHKSPKFKVYKSSHHCFGTVCMKRAAFSGFSFEGSEKCILFFSFSFFFSKSQYAGVDPCHVGKTFAPQLWFVADYCTGSGISLMK